MRATPRIEESHHPHLGPVCVVKIGAAPYGLFYGPRRWELARRRVAELMRGRPL